jgi:hypothetical protein
MLATLSAPTKVRTDVRADAKAFRSWLDTKVSAEVKRRLLQPESVVTTKDKAEIKAKILLDKTNWPLHERVTANHYRALSSDRTTRYDLRRENALSPWTCSCPATGACWHLAFMDLLETTFVLLADHLAIEAAAAVVQPAPTLAVDADIPTFNIAKRNRPRPAPILDRVHDMPVQSLRRGPRDVYHPEGIGR